MTTHLKTSVPEYTYEEPVAVIGDIHGCANLLEQLLVLIGDRPILTTGDVGDRGPDTRKVLDILIARQAKGVMGNHDQWLRQLVMEGKLDRLALSAAVKGIPTLVSYGFQHPTVPAEIEAQVKRIPKAHVGWLKALPLIAGLTVMGQRFWLSHVGVPRFPHLVNLPLDQVIPTLALVDEDNLLWAFEDPRMSLQTDRTVIMGHVALSQPLMLPHIINVDTGAGKGGGLTALLIPEMSFVTVGLDEVSG